MSGFHVSVIMPCFNAEAFIVEAINSILNQSLLNLELIIINDGSTDGTEMLVQKFTDSRIRYLSFDVNRGNYVARNKGLDIVQGKYIAMADADDVSHPNRLQTQYDYLEANPSVAAIGSRMEIIDQGGKSIGVTNEPLEYDEIKIAFLRDNCLAQPTLMFRRNLLKKGYRYDESFRYCGDYDFVQRIIQSNHVANLESALVKYRIHPTQISSSKRGHLIQQGNRTRIKQLNDWNLEYSEVEKEIQLKLLLGIYLDDTELKLAENWLNKLLEHNENTKRYHQEYFYIYCQKLASAALQKNALGGWSIEKEMLNYIMKTFPTAKILLEFGSGNGTFAFLKHFSVTSIEHDPYYSMKRASNHNCVVAPIENGWYRGSVVKEALETTEYDLILVDGPPGDLRTGILDHVGLFTQITCPIIFDDMDREDDCTIMKTFCKALDRRYRIFKGDKKSFALCTLIQ